MRLRIVLAALALTALFAGCSSTTGDDTGQNGQSIAAQQQAPVGAVPGFTVTIPKLHETSTLQGLGLNADKTIQVPSLADPMQAGIYTRGPMPGQVGPAVVLAHINAHGQPGFGAGFHTLAAGDEVDFTTPAGPVVYRVTRTQTVPKSSFPVSQVWSDTEGAELRLITCGPGVLDSTGHNYVDQTIVFGAKV